MRHPLPLLTSEVKPIDLSSRRTLFLVQDLHRPFADMKSGWLARKADSKVLRREFDEYFEALELILPNISILLDRCRTIGISVAYSCLGYWKGETPSSWQRATGWQWCLDDPEGGFDPSVAPACGERTFEKPGWGALSNPDFARYLEEHKYQNLIVVGSMFDFGVRHTCYQLADLGIGSLVVSDGVASLTRVAYQATAGNIAHGMTKLRSTAELVDLLTQLDDLGNVRV